MTKKYKKILKGSIFIFIGLLLLRWLINRKKDREKCIDCANKSLFGKNLNDPINAFNKAKEDFKNDPEKLKYLNVAERIVKLESANYTSNIYKNTHGGSFVAVTNTFPYGFTSVKDVWVEKGKPTTLYQSSNGLKYVIFPNLYIGILSIVELLQSYYKNGYTTAHYNGSDAMYISKLESYDASKLITESFNPNEFLT